MNLYADFLATLSSAAGQRLAGIKAGYNFDYGDEFEIAICRLLRQILPQNYGVARGHVVAADGASAGDDIIIFERTRMPTLGLRPPDDLASKEFIPLEAVYAYLECKHTLFLDDEGPQGLEAAVRQVRKVKGLLATRDTVGLNDVLPGVSLHGLNADAPAGFPNSRNPPFGMVLARTLKYDKKSPALMALDDASRALLSQYSTTALLDQAGLSLRPDVMVLGSALLCVPAEVRVAEKQPEAHVASPFLMQSGSPRMPWITETNDQALAVGICFLMWALDYIALGRMHWGAIIADALNAKTT